MPPLHEEEQRKPALLPFALRSNGSRSRGTAALHGEMDDPLSVATDAAGDVYLADRDNHRIQKFDSSGAFLRAWGKNVNGGGVFGICTAAATCQAGVAGALGEEMNSPVSVAADASGNLYLADSLNNRIQKFADPLPPAPPPSGAAPTGQRAAALRKCKKKFPGKSKAKKRKKCKRKANLLPA
jgi:DNA-binding beta-propeller fold protein YncE